MREFRILTPTELKTAYDTVFREAFPPQELKPLAAIEKMRELGEYEPCALFEDGLPVGNEGGACRETGRHRIHR